MWPRNTAVRLFLFAFRRRFSRFRLGGIRFGLIAQRRLKGANAESWAFFATDGNGNGAECHGSPSSVMAMFKYALLSGKIPLRSGHFLSAPARHYRTQHQRH
jgi:hypothetical protein